MRTRRSFSYYMENVRGWKPRPHQQPWVAALQALHDGTLVDNQGQPTHKLLILAFPGSGKTDTVIEYVEWVIGNEVHSHRDPRIGYVSYNDDVASVRSVAVRNTVEHNELYRRIFWDVHPAKTDGWGESEWYLQRRDRGRKDPAVRAAGMAGGILSYRFGTLIVIDDPHDEKTLSPLEKERVWRTYWNTIRTRGTLGETPILIICTRWADDDLAGRILATEDNWCVIHTPALLDDETSAWAPETAPNGEKMGLAVSELLALREQQPQTFVTQYQCLPPSQSAEVFVEILHAPLPTKEEVVAVYQSYDTAYVDKRQSSYQAMTEFVRTRAGILHITNSWKKKTDTVMLMSQMQKFWEDSYERWGVKPLVLVEDRASGTAVVQVIRAQSHLPIQAVSIHNRNLLDRSSAVSIYFKTGQVVLPDASSWQPWADQIQLTLQAYPHGENGMKNDIVSSCVLGVEYITGRGRLRLPKARVNIRGF